jgi:hypothetical protein
MQEGPDAFFSVISLSDFNNTIKLLSATGGRLRGETKGIN